MNIKCLVFNPFGENTYILWDEATKKAAIIDPGMSNDYERAVVNDFIEHSGLVPQHLLNTHMHIDHAAGNSFMENAYSLQTACNPGDNYLAQSLVPQAQLFGFPYSGGNLTIKIELEDQQSIQVANRECRILHVPGHSKGHLAFYFPDEKVVFSGDALFRMSVGRTDLPGGDHRQLIDSVETKLLSLPSETAVLPGHGPQTSIGFEAIHNPFL